MSSWRAPADQGVGANQATGPYLRLSKAAAAAPEDRPLTRCRVPRVPRWLSTQRAYSAVGGEPRARALNPRPEAGVLTHQGLLGAPPLAGNSGGELEAPVLLWRHELLLLASDSGRRRRDPSELVVVVAQLLLRLQSLLPRVAAGDNGRLRRLSPWPRAARSWWNGDLLPVQLVRAMVSHRVAQPVLHVRLVRYRGHGQLAAAPGLAVWDRLVGSGFFDWGNVIGDV